MRRIGKWLGRGILALILLYVCLWALVPQDQVDRTIHFNDSKIGPDIDSYLAAEELSFSDIRPGVAKRVIWAGEKGAKTPLAVVYIHGFSATSEEIRPVPDQVAKALGANLFYTRLAGHGRSGEAMATASAGDWINDVAEAMAIGRRLGNRVLVISTSTGGTLAAIAATDPKLSQGMAGIVMISPNFGLKPLASKILDLPAARYWGPLIAGRSRSSSPRNESEAQFWTNTYPTVALFPMAALVRHADNLDFSAAKAPLLVLYSPSDQVVDPAKTLATLSAWGGKVQWQPRLMGPGDDAYSHVIAGDILSPGQTAATVQLILAWAKGL